METAALQRLVLYPAVWAVGLMLFSSSAFANNNAADDFTAVSWSQDGAYIAAGDATGLITAWDIKQKKPVWTWPGDGKAIYKLYFNSKRQCFLAVEKYGDIVFLEEKSGREVLRVKLDFPERAGRFVAALSIASYDDLRDVLAVSGTLVPGIHLLDLNQLSGTPRIQTIQVGSWVSWEHPPQVPDSDKTSLVMSIRREHVDKANLGDFSLGVDAGDRPKDFAICRRGETLIAITADGWFVGLDISANRSTDDYMKFRRLVDAPGAGGSGYLLTVGCSADSFAISAGAGGKYGTVQLWDTKSGVVLDHVDPVYSFSIAHGQTFAADETLVATNGDLGYAIWRIEGSKLRETARIHHNELAENGQCFNLMFAPSGSLLALTENRSVFVVDAKDLSWNCISRSPCANLLVRPPEQ